MMFKLLSMVAVVVTMQAGESTAESQYDAERQKDGNDCMSHVRVSVIVESVERGSISSGKTQSCESDDASIREEQIRLNV